MSDNWIKTKGYIEIEVTGHKCKTCLTFIPDGSKLECKCVNGVEMCDHGLPRFSGSCGLCKAR